VNLNADLIMIAEKILSLKTNKFYVMEIIKKSREFITAELKIVSMT